MRLLHSLGLGCLSAAAAIATCLPAPRIGSVGDGVRSILISPPPPARPYVVRITTTNIPTHAPLQDTLIKLQEERLRLGSTAVGLDVTTGECMLPEQQVSFTSLCPLPLCLCRACRPSRVWKSLSLANPALSSTHIELTGVHAHDLTTERVVVIDHALRRVSTITCA